MGIHTTHKNDYTIVQVAIERFDVVNMQEAKDAFESILQQNSKIVIDMSKVIFMDSSGLSVLIGVLKRLKTKEDSMLKLCGLNTQAIELMEITQLNRIFDIVDSCDGI